MKRPFQISNTPRSHLVTELLSSATLVDAYKTHWREYLMEAAELAALMFCICLFGALIYSRASPLHLFALSRTV